MAQNSGALYAGVGQDVTTGTWNTAVAGTSLPPTDSTFFDTALNVAFRDAGYIGAKGVSIEQNRSFQDIRDMDGNAINTIQTESSGVIKTTFMELNQVNLENLFGAANVATTASTLVAGTRTAAAVALGEDLNPMVHVGRMKSGNKRAGIIVPNGQYTDIGALTFNNQGVASVDVSIKCIPTYDSVRLKAVDFYLFLDDGVFAVSLVPVLTSVLPTAAAVTTSVVIKGSRFTGTVAVTGVKFGGTNATSFTVVDDQTITAVMPAGSAGSAPVVVTNASGASTARAYTRGA